MEIFASLFEVMRSFAGTRVFWFLLLILLASAWTKHRMPAWKGACGERAVKKKLTDLGDEYIVYHDLYVPNEEYGLTQIDHLVLSPYGLFVIETKHYSGWIFGNEKQKYWTQVIYKKKQRMYNPVRQNYGHVQAIKTYLQEAEVPVHSIIAFSNSAELKFKEPFHTAQVVYFKQLPPTIKAQDRQVVSAEDIKKMQLRINRLTSLDKKEARSIKREHLRTVKAKQRSHSARNSSKADTESPATAVQVSNGPACPKCGGNLIRKIGKYGSFTGCEEFPSCRYTVKKPVNSHKDAEEK